MFSHFKFPTPVIFAAWRCNLILKVHRSFRELLQRTGNGGFYIIKLLPPGEYRYLFIVDGYLRCAPDLPWICDGSGNAYNVLDLQVNFVTFIVFNCSSLVYNSSLFSSIALSSLFYPHLTICIIKI